MPLNTTYQKILNTLLPLGFHSREEIENIFKLLREEWHQVSYSESLEIDFPQNRNDQWKWDDALFRLSEDEPVQYILGFAWFNNFKIKVDRNTLIPRQETEALVNLICTYEHQDDIHSIWDIGTGSGCITVSLADHFKKAKVIGTDVSEKALEIAKSNVKTILPNRMDIFMLRHDLVTSEGFNAELWISNPPYIDITETSDMSERVLRYEPHVALFAPAHDPTYFYKEIREQFVYQPAAKSLWLEINPLFKSDLEELFNIYKLTFYPYFDQENRFLHVLK